MSSKKVLVLYYSRSGNTQRMAKAIAEAMKSSAVNVTIEDVGKFDISLLPNYDGIVLGSPTYFSNVAWQVKKVIDESIVHYSGGKLKGKVAGIFTSAGTSRDGKANNPVLRDVHEYILIFCKDTFTRKNPQKRKSTISKEEFLEFTKSVWNFSAERANKVGHPAPFPIELPYRLIQLYTVKEEIALDPFVGSGTACIAASKTGRKYVAYDIDKEYCRLAEKRIKEFLLQPILFHH